MHQFQIIQHQLTIQDIFMVLYLCCNSAIGCTTGSRFHFQHRQ